MNFATAADAAWHGNFRDLAAAVTRMATLAQGGRIDLALVEEEILRFRQAWRRGNEVDADTTLLTAVRGRATEELDQSIRCNWRQ